MNPELGVLLLCLSIIATTYAMVISAVGDARNKWHLVESGRNALLMTWPLLTFAALLLIGLLVSGDYNTSYVWSVTDRSMPTYLKVTALWGGQSGSLLFWTWLLSTFTSAALLIAWDTERDLMPHVIVFSGSTLLFFLLLVTLWENPFARFWETSSGEVVAYLFSSSGWLGSITANWSNAVENAPGLLRTVFSGAVPWAAPAGSSLIYPPDGEGLNPLLRHPGMIIHPPILYLGFVGFTIPYAFGMAALVRGTVDTGWISTTRRWTLAAWLFLSLGLILGGWWAYDVLGWGGYWAWDPVENAALMPWLTGTAFLHSVMIQEKRGMLRRWNMVLITLTYLLVVLGTFATRSGVVSSVHSFAQSAVGPLFYLYFAITSVISLRLLFKRWDALKADNELHSLISREAMFLVNNLLFVSIMFAVGAGTYWPVFTELLAEVIPTVERTTLGPPYFIRTTGPMFLALLLLMGVAPLTAWKHASIKRLGRLLLWPTGAALALVVLLIILGLRRPGALLGIALASNAAFVTVFEYHRGAYARAKAHGQPYWRALLTLFQHNRRRYGGYMIHLGVVIMAIGIITSSVYQLETQQAVSAGQTITLGNYILEYDEIERFQATDGRFVTRANAIIYRDGQPLATIQPRSDTYPSGQPMSIPAKVSTPLGDDFYVLLVYWEPISMSSATFKVYYNPLINWVWGGGLVFIFGTLIAAWPEGERRTKQIRQPLPRRIRLGTAAGD